MPCSDDYNSPCDMNALLASNRLYDENVLLKNRNDKIVRLLCMLCRHAENKTMPAHEEAQQLADWWQQHRKFDEEHEAKITLDSDQNKDRI